jgi:hypothetical protein
MRIDIMRTNTMKKTTVPGIAAFMLLAGGMAFAQAVPAPNISGMAVQGMTVNMNYFRDDKNVLVVFYRMHN